MDNFVRSEPKLDQISTKSSSDSEDGILIS